MSSESIASLRRLNQHYAFASIQMHEAIARKAGVSGTDHKYLGFLMEKGQMTAGEMAHLTGLTTGAVTGLIDRFEKKKLVKRQYDTQDRRKVFIVPLTENIMALLSPLYKDYREKIEGMMASFSEEETSIIRDFLLKSIHIMEEKTNLLHLS
ncbi:MarR family transcriptional regulator [Marinilongibacter aquaticus]|uniref:MarR family winged helix-turn-helix transcriptional regulator n=1 Tax=Marinilongibacter aquaticus TaxID=2975157 RepID=UPI0021BD1F5C|nr:MarR family transcriptional regulator [Marinilongibacter aquaticus]UBM58572.1 MarR family transcriptional regulator [Marinilongibacter aquaticus]